MSERLDVVVVGGGISGLVAAGRLLRLGARVALLEASDAAGGVIRSLAWNGCTVENGPNSFLAYPELEAIVAAAGVADRRVEPAPAARNRYVVRGGRLQAAPRSPPALLTSRLFSLHGKARLLLEPVLRQAPPPVEESVRGFVERHFGPEVYRYLAQPFVSGVYAGDAERLSASAAFPALTRLEDEHGSVLVGAFRSLKKGGRLKSIAIRGGNQLLPRAIAAGLGGACRLGARVERVEAAGSGVVAVLAGGESLAARRCLLALPAGPAAALVEKTAPRLAAALRGFETAPVAVVHTLLDSARLVRPLDGFGHLVPRSEGMRHLGSIWTSALFPDRAPAGRALITTFLGGVLDPDAARLSEGEAVALVDREHRALGIYRGEPLAARRDPGPAWIPQYTLGHRARVEAAEAHAADELPGLHLGGSSYRGVSVGDCAREAEALAARVAAALASPPR